MLLKVLIFINYPGELAKTGLRFSQPEKNTLSAWAQSLDFTTCQTSIIEEKKLQNDISTPA